MLIVNTGWMQVISGWGEATHVVVYHVVVGKEVDVRPCAVYTADGGARDSRELRSGRRTHQGVAYMPGLRLVL